MACFMPAPCGGRVSKRSTNKVANCGKHITEIEFCNYSFQMNCPVPLKGEGNTGGDAVLTEGGIGAGAEAKEIVFVC